MDIRTEGEETVIEAHGHALKIDSSGAVHVLRSSGGAPPNIVYAERGEVAAAPLEAEPVSEKTEIEYLTGGCCP